MRDLNERLLEFAVKVIALLNVFPRSILAATIIKQLMRSATSAGSNYEEACGAESRADFAHKLAIVLKELKESRFWLLLIGRTRIVRNDRVDPVLQECEELCAIIAKSILTVRQKRS